jgi:2-polyprenyl-6-hydroxyphenyl methylase / 3-demethylubiquinone-9 3-methyltransferase
VMERDGAFEKDWNSYSDLIDGRKEAPEWEVIRQVRLTHWQEFFRIQPGQRVLDAGCGNGDYTALVCQAGARVWAFDLSPRMVDNTRRRLIRNNVGIEELTVGSVTAINYPDKFFDVVMCLSVIDHVPDGERQHAVNELARVLRPGGVLYINTPNRFAYPWRIGLWIMTQLGLFPKGKIRFITPGQLRRLVRRAGLKPGRSLGLEFIPPFSGIYTTDLRRLTFLPERIIRPLDRAYLAIEKWVRRRWFLKWFCYHFFLEAVSESSSPP